MKKNKFLLVAIFLSFCCSLIITSGKAQASSADILRKWARINGFECVVDNSALHSPVEARDSNGSLKTSEVLSAVTAYQTDWVLTPSYGFGGTTPGSSVPCTQVIGYKKGYNGMTSLLSYGGMSNLANIKWNSSSPSDVDKLLGALDYVGREAEDGGGRFSIKANRKTRTCTTTIQTYCSESEWEASTVGITVTRQADGNLWYERDPGNTWNDLKVSLENHNLILEVKDGLTCTGGGRLEEPLQSNLNTMYSNLEKSLTNLSWTLVCTNTTVNGILATVTESTSTYTFGVSGKVVDSGSYTQYVIEDQPEGVANKVNRKLTGSSGRRFTSTEEYELYDFYLNEAIKSTGAVANLKTCNPTSKNGLEPVKLLDTSDNTFKTCYANFNGKSPADYKVNAPNDSFTKIIEITMQDVINRLNNLDTSNIDISAITGVSSSTDPYNPLPGTGGSNTGGGGDNDTTISECLNAAGSLGWIYCPVLQMAGDAAMGLYKNIEDTFLWIGSDVMGTGNATHQAWAIFRNYANIAFVIMFLIVILSQITGFGISNYGIKKVLPRLIAVALLTNLSFIICQLAVDLSDIVGAGVKDVLTHIQVTNNSTSEYGVDNVIGSIFGFLFSGGLYGGTIILGAVTWRLWLLPLLLVIIGALIGIFMFFLSLAVREAGIIILVVLCPVAIICYALPNTKKLFDKWFRMFTSLLMVYPICGLLMGGGQFASSVLVNLGDNDNSKFMLTLTAMLLSVVPFFFIPTIVRTSLNAIGQLGARLSNFGRGFSRGLTGMIRGSERYKDAQRELATRHDEATVRRLDRRAAKLKADGKELSAGAQRRRTRAYMRADKARREDLIGRAYRSRALLQDDEGRQEQLMENLTTKDLEEGVAGAKALYRTKDEMAKEENITKEHDKVLAAFGNNPEDLQLYKQLRALEEMDMEKGAPGQDLLHQSIARWIADNNKNNSWNDNKRAALKRLSAGLSTRYGKEINSSDKSFISQLSDFSNGDFDKLNSFRAVKDKNGKDVYISDYDTKLANFSAAGLKNATPGALQRGVGAMQDGIFKDVATERAMLGKIAQAFDDKIIANDIKPTEKGYLQDILGYGASKGRYNIAQYDDALEKNNYDVFTNMEQGTLDNLAQFIDNADGVKDRIALEQLGENIVASAGSGRTYSENDTKRIQKMLNILGGKVGRKYTFDPSAVKVNQGSGEPDDYATQEYQKAQQAVNEERFNEEMPPTTAMADEDFRKTMERK